MSNKTLPATSHFLLASVIAEPPTILSSTLNDITNLAAAPPIFEKLFLISVSSAKAGTMIRASAFLARFTEDGKQWWNDNSIV
jgi:hypothetical protein